MIKEVANAVADALEAAQAALQEQSQKIASLEASRQQMQPALDQAKVGQIADVLIAKGLHKEAEREAVIKELADPNVLAQKYSALVAQLPETGSKRGVTSFGRNARENGPGNKPVKKSDEVWSQRFG